MALVKCKECGNENAKNAKTCPKCGKKVLIGVGVFVVLSMLAAAGGKKNGSTTVEAAAIQGVQAVAAAQAAGTLEFGKPTVKPMAAGMTEIDVEVKNVSGHDLTGCTMTATFKKGDTILATANSAVNQLPAGVTRTAQFVGMGSTAGYDALKLEASTCF
jgi:hypothetical protein